MSAAGKPEYATRPSLAAAAARSEFLERTRLFHGRSEISLPEVLTRHVDGLTFNAVGVTATVRNHALEDVVLDADSLLLFKHRQAIAETAYFEPADAIRQLPEAAELTSLPDNEDLPSATTTRIGAISIG